MDLNKILQFFVPKDKVFMPLFEQSSSYLIELAETLNSLSVSSKSEREDLYKKITELEVKIESISQNMRLELSKNFITPFDREDIYALIKSIENVADYIHGSAELIHIYHVEKISKSMRKLTQVNLDAVINIGLAVKELKTMRNHEAIAEACKKINKLERKSDEIYNKSVEDIFENENDVKNIIKYKEVLSALENATDMCKRVANVLEQISVKHS